ncbi:glycosyltransferase [Croceicoccus marinus]|uniref:Glycosyltransferase n=1 Tax=Croceicoccus marinus TaxID=450378 RepID=A0A7G6VWS8_9SPHN|nr:glycosyltransferase [Croceicoccus marinus]QNE06193.1 glycosyltransferase [Croceicoccus marinus]
MPESEQTAAPIDVLLWGCCDMGKPRTRIALAAMKAAGIPVRSIRKDLWSGVEDKSRLGRTGMVLFALRYLFAYPALVLRFLLAPRPDAILLAYPGLIDALVIGPLARRRGIPVVWDVFICAYDTVVRDRKMLDPDRMPARLLRFAERLAAGNATKLVLDTRAHARLFAELYDVPSDRLSAILVGAEADAFSAAKTAPFSCEDCGPSTRVLFYGQFIPLHGIDTIIRAASLPEAAGIEWTIIGTGQETRRIRQMVDSKPVANVEWIDWCDYRDLHRHIRRADVTLGIFGHSEKAASVIPNKVFQLILSGKPVVTRDSPAMRELLAGDEAGIALVPPGDPQALLTAIRRLAAEPRHTDHTAIAARFSIDALGKDWRAVFEEVLDHGAPHGLKQRTSSSRKGIA